MKSLVCSRLAATFAALSLTFAAASSHAALTIIAGTAAGTDIHILSGGAGWNTTPAGSVANAYWDADNDGVFGETGIGENTGNSTSTLGFNAPITSGESVYIGLDGFGSASTTGSAEFTIQKSDTSTVRDTVVEGTHWLINDSDGSWWEAVFEFNKGAYGDVVSNISTGAGGNTADHQGVLTFTQLPMFTANADAGSTTIIGAVDGSPVWDNAGAGTITPDRANWYVDANGDRTFENSGDTNASLAYSTPIYDGLKLEFVMQAFTPGVTDVFRIAGFDILNPDGSIEVDGGLIADGSSLVFTDSNGQMWQVDGVWTQNGAGGDYVFNLGIHGSPGTGADDHLFTLTFNTIQTIPAPSALPVGLGMLGLVVSRRSRRAPME